MYHGVAELPKLLQEKLLDAVASEGAGMHVSSALVSGVGRHVDSSGKRLPPSHSEQSPVCRRQERALLP